MRVSTPLFEDFMLTIADDSGGENGFPTGRLQKGLLLVHAGRELAEEGVGFGVPILKRSMQTVFAGGVALEERDPAPVRELTAIFEMNLVERLARPGGGSLESRSIYAVKDSLAALHRRSPRLRRPLSAASAALRKTFRWKTTYEEAESSAALTVRYAIDGGRGQVAVAVDTAGLRQDGVTEIVMMNELGARHFDRYEDSDGTALEGEEIGTWDEVAAENARFVCGSHQVAFSLAQVEGARLHRGRELVGPRLAWSGFGYSFAPARQTFGYDLTIEKVSR